MIRRRLPLPSSGSPFLSCFHLVTAFHFLRKHQTNRLRLSPDLLPQSCGLKSLKYTKYSCASQVLSCAKISRRTLLPIDSEFPNISSKPFGIWAKKEREYPAAQLLLRRGHSRNLWALRPKKKSGRNLSCGHGNSTGNRKSLTIRVQVGILRTLRLSCHKRYAQISITSQLYHKILWLSRKQRLTALTVTWMSVPPGDIHAPEAAQNTAVTDAGSPHAPTGLLQLLFFLFCVGHNCPSIIALSLSCITSYHELWLFVNGFSE